MRLLHVFAGPFPSHQGTQAFLRDLLTAQLAAGHRVTLRCWSGGVGSVPDGLDLRRLRPLPGADRLQSGPHPTRARLALALLAALRRDLREPFDMVHAHHVEAPLLARLARARPVIHHLHTALSEELPTYGVPGGRVLGAVLDRACVRAADGTLALSERGAELARRWGARRALAVPPGLPDVTGDAARGRAAFDLHTPTVVYSGNLDAYQELDRLVEAAADHDLPVLLLTGDDPSERLDHARRAGAHRLRAVRTRELSDHLDALAAATVSVVPRAACAGVPIKLLNSLAVGTPVVALRGAVDPRPGVILTSRAELGAALRDLLGGSDAAPPVPRRSAADAVAEIDAFQAMILAGR